MKSLFKKIFFSWLLIFTFAFAETIFAKEYTVEEAAKIRSAVVANVKTRIGCPYRTGAIGPDAFDCSGLIFTVFREAAGIQMPRSVKAIYSAVNIIPQDQIEEGDLVFFKTTGDGSISHVGIYIGRNQFIHAASDGSNTGVIVSSLTEKYYKNCYAGVGKPLSSAKKNSTQPVTDIEEIKPQKEQASAKSSSQSSSSYQASYSSSSASNSSFASNIEIDAIVAGDWSLWLPNEFTMNFRGITMTAIARYAKHSIQPGIGTSIKWNYGCGCVQFPIFFNLKINEYTGFYFGPMFTIGNTKMPPRSYLISNSSFPAILGVSFNTPSFKIGTTRVSLSQDISYTFYSNKDGGPLNAAESFIAGFVFSTGIRVTLPLKNVLN